jgi:hypothetical protein
MWTTHYWQVLQKTVESDVSTTIVAEIRAVSCRWRTNGHGLAELSLEGCGAWGEVVCTSSSLRLARARAYVCMCVYTVYISIYICVCVCVCVCVWIIWVGSQYWCYIPESCHVHTNRHENQKSHILCIVRNKSLRNTTDLSCICKDQHVKWLFSIYRRLCVAFIDQFAIQRQGFLKLCSCLNNQFLINESLEKK